MKLHHAILITLVLASPARAQAPAEAAASTLKSTTDQASYAIGLNIGRGLKSNGALNVAVVLEAIRDVLTDSEPRLSDEQCRTALMAYERDLQASRTAIGQRNKMDGAAFLEANKGKSGVKTLPSGLQYKVLKSGNGPSPTVTDSVVAHYHGKLIDGTTFDSSIARNEPAVFPVNGVIRGWTEALQLMKVGDKWQLFIPSSLAYGPDGRGQIIGPNAVLVFDVELLGIQ